MKRVGVLLRKDKNTEHQKILGIHRDLLDFLWQYKEVQWVFIAVDYNLEHIKESFERVVGELETLDGILFPGGSKVYAIDLLLIDYAYKKNLPTLGICLGMQAMGIYLGGKMQTLEDHSHKSNENYVHSIDILENTKLYEILKEKNIQVNSRHQDYICSLKKYASAYSPDFIMEALEDSSKTFFLGVQWHPESLIKDVYSKRLFDAFIQSL